MKNFLIISFLLFSSLNIFSQNSIFFTEQSINDDFETQLKYLPNNQILLVSNSQYMDIISNAIISKPCLYILDSNGSILHVNSPFNFSDNVHFDECILTDTSIVFFGFRIINNYTYFIIWESDFKLNGNLIKSFSLGNNLNECSVKKVVKHFQSYYILSSREQEHNFTIIKTNSNFDSTNYFLIDSNTMPFTLSVNKLNNHLKIFTAYYFSGSFGNIITLDTNLNYVSKGNIPNYLCGYNTVIDINDSTYFLCGTTMWEPDNYPSSYYDYDIAIEKLNWKDSLLSIRMINIDKTRDKPGFSNSFVKGNRNGYYLSGTINFTNFYHSDTSQLLITKLDSDLNTIWEKRFGGNKKYYASSILPLNNGGLLVSTQICVIDYNSPYFYRDIYIYKLDEFGNLLNTIKIPLLDNSNLNVFPNPAISTLTLSSTENQNLPEGFLKIFNLQGQCVYDCNINGQSSDFIFDVKQLSNGLYIGKLNGIKGENLMFKFEKF